MKKIFTSLLLGLGLFASSYAQNQVLDQKSVNLAAINGNVNPTGGANPRQYGQSFVAGMTGTLSSIDIHVTSVSTNGFYYLYVREGSGFEGNLLSTSGFEVNGSTVPNDFLKVNLNSTPVTSGNTFTFIIAPNTSPYMQLNITADTEYANGSMFYKSGSNAAVGLARDLIFRTYVTPPCATTTSTSSASNCDIYYWNGISCDATGAYTKTLVNAEGCDSIATLNFTRIEPTTSTTTHTVCGAYEWNGKTYTESGSYTTDGITQIAFGEEGSYEYTNKFVNSKGCDSLATLILTIDETVFTSTSDATTCNNSYLWNGTYYSENGTYTKTGLKTANGCDSVATINLTFYPKSESTTIVDDVCGSYEWNGDTYTESGIYEAYFDNQYGCDSIAYLDITFNSHEGLTDTVKSCEPYEWYGDVYDKSGLYSQRFTAQDGCDSTVYLALSFNSTIDFSGDFMFNSCKSDIFFTSTADSLVKINGQVIEGKTLVQWGEYDDYSSYTSNHYPDGIDGAPDGYSWIPDPNDEERDDHYFTVRTSGDEISGGKVIVHQTLNPGAIKEVYVITYGGEEVIYELIASPTPALISSNVPVIAEFPFTTENVVGVKIVLTKEFGLLHGIDAIGIETAQLEYRLANAPTGEYTIEAISKGGCLNTQIIEFENNNKYDTITETSCEAYTYYDDKTGDRVVLSKTGVYNFITYSEESECSNIVHLDFTFTGIAYDTTIVSCDDEYYWEDADMDLDETGVYSYQFYNEETGCDSVVNINFIMNETPQVYFAMSEPDGSFCVKSLVLGSEAETVKLNGVLLTQSIVEDGPPFPVYIAENLKDINYTLEVSNAGGVCLNVYTWRNKVADYDTLTYKSCTGIESPSGMFINKTGVYQDTISGEGEEDCEVVYTIYYTDTTFKASISFIEGALETDYVSATATYTWFDCDTEEEITGSENSITPPYEGSFNTTIEDKGCTVSIECYDMLATGTSKSVTSTLLNVYPNPSTGNFIVELNSNQNYDVINSLGSTVMKGSLLEGVNALDLRSLNEGIYFLTIDAQVTKLIVRK